MDLKRWQKDNRWQTQEMAKQIGVTTETLSRIRNKKNSPCLLTAQAIIKFTKGEVTLEDLGVEEK